MVFHYFPFSLPHMICGDFHHPRNATIISLRDHESYKHAPGSRLPASFSHCRSHSCLWASQSHMRPFKGSMNFSLRNFQIKMLNQVHLYHCISTVSTLHAHTHLCSTLNVTHTQHISFRGSLSSPKTLRPQLLQIEPPTSQLVEKLLGKATEKFFTIKAFPVPAV